MLSLREPTPETISRFLREQSACDFSYSAVGATSDRPPAGYVVDRTRVRLGTGIAAFEAAKSALANWRQFDLGWLRAAPPGLPVRSGEVVAIVARSTGLWWLNACRIVYVVDEAERRFGFAYGTLPDHAGSGEERFLIELDPADGAVWYDVLAFSRPRHPLARLGYPLMRRAQRRFGRDTAAAMRKAVCGEAVEDRLRNRRP